MHELSIALGIVDLANRELKKSSATKVDSIELEIGKMAGVEPMALDFAWPEATKNTILEHAERIINYLPGKAICLECQHEYDLENYFDECPKCNSYFKDVIQGKELRVKALVVS